VIDQILADKGYAVLRLLLYHPYLYPTEVIWADVNNGLQARTQHLKLRMLSNCGAREIGREEWENVCQHVENLNSFTMSRKA
jgi:hypothetical protein